MKKTIALFLIALLPLLLFASCGKDDDGKVPYGMKLASDTAVVDYSLFVPEDWEIVTAAGMTMAQVSFADSTNVVVTHHSNSTYPEYSDPKEILDEYYQDYIVKLAKMFDPAETASAKEADEATMSDSSNGSDSPEDPAGESGSSFVLVETPAYITLKKGDDNVAALRFVYTATLDGAEIQQMMVLAYEDAYFYNITFTTTPSFYDNNVKTFETILENFRFKG